MVGSHECSDESLGSGTMEFVRILVNALAGGIQITINAFIA
jgi:hypothetical protein